MTEKVAKLINDQINHEFYSAYLYLEFANYFSEVGLDGFENWYKIQAQEERDHAMLFMQFLHNNAIKVSLEAISKPDCSLNHHIDPLKAALKHEQFVTSLIHNIYGVAFAEHDFRTTQLLDWFIKEQGEEEKTASDLVTKMELYGDDSKSLYMLNSELKARVYAAPSLIL